MSSERILIVEDHPGIRTSLRWNLQAAGYLVAEAEDGLAALTIMREEPPDLVLLDLSMPKMNGMVFLTELREMNPRPPTLVIVMTAHRSTPIVVEATRLGASDFLVKPVKAQELRLSIENVLALTKPAGQL
jgi:DNA-binding response OmpR family regulator